MELVGIARKEVVGTNIGTHISGDENDKSVFQRATEQMMKDSSSCRVRFCVCARVTDEQDSDSSEDDEKHHKTSHPAAKTSEDKDATPSKQPCGKCHKCGTASAVVGDKSADTSISSIESSESADFDTTVIRHSIDNLSIASSSHSTFSEPCMNDLCVELEGQGVVMKGRGSDPAYTMWILKPYRQMEPLSIDIPLSLFETLGFGADVFVQYLETLQQDGVTEFSNLPPPPMAMCRICERQVPTWAFESHSQLCLIEHKAESHLQQTHENLSDHREAVAALLYYSHGTSSNSNSQPNSNSSSSLASPSASGASSPSPPPPALYRGLPIALTPGEEHIPAVSGSASSSPPRSPRQTAASLVLTKKRIFQKPTPKTPTRQIQLLLELCDTALDINGPESAVHSPNTAAKIHTVQEWPSASFRKNVVDPGLKLLYEDTERLCQEKVEATMRLGNIVTYFGKIKEEVDTAVHQVLEETLYQLRLQQDANDGVEAPAEAPKNDVAANESAIASSSDLAVGDVGISTPANSVAGTESESGGPTTHGSKSDVSVPEHNASSSSLFSSHYLGTDNLPHLPAPAFSQSPQGSPNLSDSFDGMPPPPLPSSSSQSEKNVTVQIGTPAPKTPSTPHVPALSLSSSHSDLRGGASLSSDNILGVSPTKKSTTSTMTPRSFLADDMGAAKPPTPSPQMSRRPSHISRQNINRPLTTLNTNLPEFSMSDLSLSDGENRPRATSSAGGRSSNLGSPMAAPISGGNGPQRSRVHSINVEWTPLSSPLLFPYEPQVDDGIAPTPPAPVKTTQPSIKDYEIIKPISKGAFGSVYLSKKKATGEYFAIKTLKKADMIAKNQVMNVKAERAILMAQQDSPFVARLFFTFQNRDYLFLVMEYLSGGDCAALIKMLGGLPSDWITKYMAEVVAGVEDLHGRGIVHRDLKPDNLLLDSEGHIKLTDFGLSRMGYVGRYTKPGAPSGADTGSTTESGARGSVSSNDSRRSSNFDTIDMEHSYSLVPGYFDVGDSEDDRSRSVGSGSIRDFRERSTSRGAPLAVGPTSLSQPHPPVRQDSLPLSNMPLHDSNRKFVGTPDYLAPETIDGVGQDETSDWWSVGCIMFEFIYGYPPFHASTPELVFDNILNRRIQWPDESEDDVNIDDNTRDLLMKLLEPTPSRRLGYNGAEEIKKHPFFHHVTDWNAVYQEEASFVPMAQSPENTDYFDSRGAQMEELSVDENVDESVDSEDTDRDSVSSPSEFPKIVSSARSDSSSPSQVTSSSGVRRVSSTGSGGGGGGSANSNSASNSTRKVPLHIPPHVRERRSRRLSETSDDFGNFSFKNLPVLDKANKDIINRLKAETLPIPVPRKESATSATGSSEDGSPSTGLGLSSSPATSATTSGSSQFLNKLSASGLSPSPRGLGLQRRLSTLSDSPESPILAPPKMRRQPSAASAASAASESSPYNSDDDRERARLRVQKRRQMSRRFSSISLTESPSFRPLYVLVCDPNPVWRYSISHILKELNCHIATVKTGSEAIRRGTSDTRFDCILTEYNLPKVNGEDVAKLIHSTNNANTSTPIVAVTSYLKAASETALFSAVIEKPVRRDVLSETLQRFCNWKEPDE